jgi:hypothetical protein
MRVGRDLVASVPLAEQMVAPTVTKVGPTREASVELAHPLCQALLRDSDDAVVVIRHLTPLEDDPLVLLLASSEELEEDVAVEVVEVELLPVVPSRVDVVVAVLVLVS